MVVLISEIKMKKSILEIRNYNQRIWVVLILSILKLSLVESVQNITNYKTNAQPTNFTHQIVSYKCPSYCKCTYESDSQHLKINCHESSNHLVPKFVSLTGGVRKFGISHTIISEKSIKELVPKLNSNSLIEINLHHVSMQPLVFLNSDIIKKSKSSLRKIRLHAVSDYETSLPKPWDIKSLIPYFSNLEKLDSLTVTDCSSLISAVILNGLPQTNHITLYNSAVKDLQPAMFSKLKTLQSLNLSSNYIEYVPWGMFSDLEELKILDLSQNGIQHLQEEIFVGLEGLQKLNVSNNRIRYIDTEVFNPLKSIHLIDLSGNNVIQIFEPYFQENTLLRQLLMVKTWAKTSFTDAYTASRSLMEMDKLIDTLQSVETLDLRNNEMKVIPETLTHLPRLKHVYLDGNDWDCSCADRWVIDWISTTKVLIDDKDDTKNMWCKNDDSKHQFVPYIDKLNCNNSQIIAKTPKKYYGLMGKSITMECHTQRGHNVTITWQTPQKENITSFMNTEITYENSHTRVLKNGNLLITNLTKNAYGLYICTASYDDLNIVHYVHLGMDTSIFLSVKLVSVIVGWITSFGFLFTVLAIQFVRYILSRFGIECPSVSAPRQTKHVRRFLESMEQHKNSQLLWLKDNYNMQAKRIKDNCMSQMERIRESYATQSKNLSDMRDYGAQQLQTEIRRVSHYSTHQLCRVRENYLFQRNRVGKFSSHQLLKLRETYKWQAQTLSKILENLPNFDACRGIATCGRTDSIYLDDLTQFTTGEILLNPDELDKLNGRVYIKDHLTLALPSELSTLLHPLGGTCEAGASTSSGNTLLYAEKSLDFYSNDVLGKENNLLMDQDKSCYSSNSSFSEENV